MAGFPVINNAKAALTEQFSVTNKEWLECQDFIIASKAHKVGWMPVNVDSLRHFKALAQDAFSVSHYKNDMIIDEIGAARCLIFKAAEIMEVAGEKISTKIKCPLEKLREVPPEDKRKVLRYAQIIPTAIAAAYIGVSDHALKVWSKYLQVFGANYAGGHCYSLVELKMIANNRSWIYCEIEADERRIIASDDEKSLDEVVTLDYDFAAAFTGMTNEELREHLPRNQLSKRPFRLSDLEKVRVAMLNETL